MVLNQDNSLQVTFGELRREKGEGQACWQHFLQDSQDDKLFRPLDHYEDKELNLTKIP